MIEVKNLVKRYGDQIAVDHLSFTVEEGQIYGFLGPNGAGKSTTMNMMTGYLAPTEGEVLINGISILEEPEKAKKQIGYLPEIPPLYLDMTVMEYLKFAAELKGIEKNDRVNEIEKAVEKTKLGEVKDRLIRNLSKGYRQRVGLAQAILGTPPVIILDEPTVGLDPQQIIEIRDLIKKLGEHHIVLLSSHILSEVQAVCDYVLIISRGKLVASDTPENLELLFTGTDTINLTIKASKETAEKLADEIEGILNIEIKEDANQGTVDLTIQTAKDLDIREELFYACVKLDCPVLMMKVSAISLEEVFLELVSDTESIEKKEEEDAGNL